MEACPQQMKTQSLLSWTGCFGSRRKLRDLQHSVVSKLESSTHSCTGCRSLNIHLSAFSSGSACAVDAGQEGKCCQPASIAATPKKQETSAKVVGAMWYLADVCCKLSASPATCTSQAAHAGLAFRALHIMSVAVRVVMLNDFPGASRN